MPLRIRSLLFISFLIPSMGCVEHWSENQQQQIHALSDKLEDQIRLETTYTQMRHAYDVDVTGNREADLLTLKRSNQLIDIVMDYPDSIGVNRTLYNDLLDVMDRVGADLKDLLSDSPQNAELLKTLMANKIANYHRSMIGVNDGFHYYTVRLWQSLADQSLYKTGIGSKQEDLYSVLLKETDNKVEILHRGLYITSHAVEWKLIFETDIIQYLEVR